LRDQVEEAIRVREAAGLAGLEGDPAFGVEADPSTGGTNKGCRGVGAANPRRRELAGEEEDRVAVTALDHQGALGDGHVKHGGC
jgi:hypothetical protein